MLLSDGREPVSVSLCVEDWAVILLALSGKPTDLDTTVRINETIYECARNTERTLS